MAYEYEDKINEAFFIAGRDGRNVNRELLAELQEVYRKARAWDNYLLSVEKDAKNEFGDNQALIKHAVELNKKIFMEDE